jgi:hypothetical protein
MSGTFIGNSTSIQVRPKFKANLSETYISLSSIRLSPKLEFNLFKSNRSFDSIHVKPNFEINTFKTMCVRLTF